MDKKRNTSLSFEGELLYFAQFAYAPTVEELYTFLPEKTAYAAYLQELNKAQKAGKIVISGRRVALKKDRGFFATTHTKALIAWRKAQRARKILAPLRILPSIQFVGLTGSVAAGNANDGDDIDVFIITTPQALWFTRFVVLVYTHVLGVRRSYGENKVKNKLCFNLWFTDTCLQVPPDKQNRYIAHEILQCKPVINKRNTHVSFLQANKWILHFYPNAFKLSVLPQKQQKAPPLSPHLLEAYLKQLQLRRINRRRTKERITDCQLWFYPEDFEQKLKIK